ncbi:MAG: hypothetical protein ACRYGR_07160 [Janthinobacterium lividum]
MAPRLRSQTQANTSWDRLPLEVKHLIIKEFIALLVADPASVYCIPASLDAQLLTSVSYAFGHADCLTPLRHAIAKHKESEKEARQQFNAACDRQRDGGPLPLIHGTTLTVGPGMVLITGELQPLQERRSDLKYERTVLELAVLRLDEQSVRARRVHHRKDVHLLTMHDQYRRTLPAGYLWEQEDDFEVRQQQIDHIMIEQVD